MKKLFFTACFIFTVLLAANVKAFAAIGDMGFFGGITEGTRLPKTTEQMVAATNTRRATARELTNLTYKEVVFLSGQPVEIVGLLSVRQQGDVVDTDDVGTYRITYTVGRSAATDENNSIVRTMTFVVNWRREGTQIVRDMEVSAWTETLVLDGVQYGLDFAQSYFSVSTLEDKTPGVTFSKGNTSMRAVYTAGDLNITHVVYGTLYGYNSAWSNTETQRLNGEVFTDDWQLGYQVRPSVSMFKTLQYSKNEPTIISFDGNYMEVMQNRSGLSYDIFNVPQTNIEMSLAGSVSIDVRNTFEQLPTFDLSAYTAHFAVTDIHKLFSMGIITGTASQYNPTQLVTRGQFVTMLVNAIKLPVEAVTTTSTRSTRAQEITFTFPDVLPSNPQYPQIMAAYKAGIAGGRGNGLFYADYPIQREEALVMLLRTIGLGNLGLDPVNITPFTDDDDISSWAKKEIYAAAKINIISGDSLGKIYPKDFVSKGEAAAIVNALIEYMRTGMQTDYAEYIVNFAD